MVPWLCHTQHVTVLEMLWICFVWQCSCPATPARTALLHTYMVLVCAQLLRKLFSSCPASPTILHSQVPLHGAGVCPALR